MSNADFDNYIFCLCGYPAQAAIIPNALLSPSEFAHRQNEAVYGDIRQYTHGTSLMRILVPHGFYSFTSRSADFSQRIYVNGVWLLDIGRPGDSKESSVPNTGRFIFSAPSVELASAGAGVIELVQQSSNFVHRTSGGHLSIRIGTGSYIADYGRAEDFQASILIGCYFIMFLLFFLLYFTHGRVWANLCFALFCFMWFLRVGVIRGRVFTVLLPFLDWETKFRIEYIAIPTALALGFFIINSLFPKVLHKTGLYIIYAVSAVFAVFFLFAGTIDMSHALQYLYMVYGLVIIYFFSCFGWHIFNRKNGRLKKINYEQGIFLAGLVVFIVAAIYDFTFYNALRIFDRVFYEMTSLSLLIFAICTATAVFIATMKEQETLKQKERELALANMSLENRIDNLQKELIGLFTLRNKVQKDIILGSLKLNRVSNRAYEDGRDMLLTSKEFALLLLFVGNAGQYLMTEHLYKMVWELPIEFDRQNLRKHISNLRKKLEEGNSAYTIYSDRNKGYCLDKI